ncbi:MAG: hypothetical protein STSR0008_01060 [Ignavibacterium sp.]
MNKKYTILFFLFFISFIPFFLFSQNNKNQILFSEDIKHISTYSYIDIKIFENGKSIILGNNLFFYNGTSWNYFIPQPPFNNINLLFAKSENDIWITYDTKSNESFLFHFDGKIWNKIQHPFANAISAIFVNNNSIFLAGDREFAFYNEKEWKFIPLPFNNKNIVKIIGFDIDSILINTLDSKLYFFNGKNWKQYFSNKEIRCLYSNDNKHIYAVSDSNLYKLNNSKWEIFIQDSLFKEIRKFVITSDSIFYGINYDSMIVKIDKNHNEKNIFKVDGHLNNIDMLNDKVGWVVGENHLILKLMDMKKYEVKNKLNYFSPMKIISTTKEISDEYGVAISDVNNDGLDDIYAVSIFGPNHLYINQSNKNSHKYERPIFSEEAIVRDVTAVSVTKSSLSFAEIDLGAGSADIDNDGDDDLYVCNLNGKNKLFINDGNGFFRDVSNQTNRANDESERTNSVSFADVDNDGDLDLFITNEYSSNRLFLNNGSGYFTLVTKEAGLITLDGGMSASFGDVDGDNKIDLCVVNWSRKPLLYKNISENKKVKFTLMDNQPDLYKDSLSKCNAVVFADIDNDGDLDLFITKRKAQNKLFINDGKGNFTDQTNEYFENEVMLSYGASFSDFDNDSFLDLFVANVGENKFYKNINGKKFIDITNQFNYKLNGYSTGTAVSDIDNDGDVDLYVANYIDESSMLLINNTNNKNFISIKINGVKSNKNAIGTKVWLYESNEVDKKYFLCGYQEINGGSGYASMNSTQVHFGVDPNKNYSIIIFFPSSGIKKVISNIKAGTFLYINEIEGYNASILNLKNSIGRYLNDYEFHNEIIKLLFVLFIIFLFDYFLFKKLKQKINFIILLSLIFLSIYLIQIHFLIYREFLFSALLPISSIFILSILTFLYFDRNLTKQKIIIEKQKVRDKIARDLHDDIASSLSSGLIYTDVLQNGTMIDEEESKLLDKIKNIFIETSEAITDIIWMASPTYSKFSHLINRIKLLINDICSTNSIKHNIYLSDNLPDFTIQDEMRRNIYLIFKEALNNTIKYSGATAVIFSVYKLGNKIEFVLKDNGIGLQNKNNINTDVIKHGKGLINMKKRADEINAELKINSEPNLGTEIILITEFTQSRYSESIS